MVEPPTTRDLIDRLVWLNRRITVAELSRRSGVSRQRVHQILNALRWELHQEWRKKKGR